MNERDQTERRCPALRNGRRCNALLGRGRAELFETKCLHGHLVLIEGALVTAVEDSRTPELAGASLMS